MLPDLVSLALFVRAVETDQWLFGCHQSIVKLTNDRPIVLHRR